MTALDPNVPTLTGDQVIEMLDLVGHADSVELKATVPADGRVARKLDLDPLGAQIRQVFFFDTPELALSEHGLVVRARRVQGREHDSVVKSRPIDPATLPKQLRKSPEFGVEVDAMPGGFVCSASLQGVVDADAILKTAFGNRPIRKLFSKAQRAFYDQRAPHGLGLDELSVMGRILVLKLKWLADDLPHKMVAELWTYPDGSLILELSTKCTPADLISTVNDTRTFLDRRGVELSAVQATKTKTGSSSSHISCSARRPSWLAAGRRLGQLVFRSVVPLRFYAFRVTDVDCARVDSRVRWRCVGAPRVDGGEVRWVGGGRWCRWRRRSS
jgi:hypothetical protein